MHLLVILYCAGNKSPCFRYSCSYLRSNIFQVHRNNNIISININSIVSGIGQPCRVWIIEVVLVTQIIGMPVGSRQVPGRYLNGQFVIKCFGIPERKFTHGIGAIWMGRIDIHDPCLRGKAEPLEIIRIFTGHDQGAIHAARSIQCRGRSNKQFETLNIQL